MSADLVIRNDKHYLAVCSEIRVLVAEIETVEAAKDLADRAAAAQTWARRARLSVHQVNLATSAKLWAERRAGELLAAMRERGERATGAGVRELQGATLVNLGISKDESARWQKLAAIKERDFDAALDHSAEQGRVSAAGVIRAASGSYVASPPEDLHDTRREIRTLWDRATIFNQYDIRANLRKMQPSDREELIERLIEAKEALDKVIKEATSIQSERPRLRLADTKGA